MLRTRSQQERSTENVSETDDALEVQKRNLPPLLLFHRNHHRFAFQ